MEQTSETSGSVISINASDFLNATGNYSHPIALTLAQLSEWAYLNAVDFKSRLADRQEWCFEPSEDFIDASRLDQSGPASQTSTQLFIVSSGKTALVLFRGSEAKPDDWEVNATFAPTNGPGGHVHAGFWNALDAVWDKLRDRLAALKTENLWLGGHSLGGALAVLAAARLRYGKNPIGEGKADDEFGHAVRGIYTFGQPRVGDWQFAFNYEDELGLKTYRFVNRDDIVARLPPSLLGFRHVGRRLYFDQIGVLGERDRAADMVGEKFAEALGKARAADKLTDIADHSIAEYLRLLRDNSTFVPETLEAVSSRQVMWAERKALQAEHHSGTGNASNGSAVTHRPEPAYVGLALSGGGIRSATFNLGLLQALASCGLLSRIDYLSTVSGGGYIGGWLSAWTFRCDKPKTTATPPVKPARPAVEIVEERLGGAGRQATEKFNDAGEPREVTWLRRFSNYLTPRTGPFSADTLTGVATWLRNTLLNQLLLMSCLALLLVVVWALVGFAASGAQPHGVANEVPPLGIAPVDQSAAFAFVVWISVMVATFLLGLSQSRQADKNLQGSMQVSLGLASLFGFLWTILPFLLLAFAWLQQNIVAVPWRFMTFIVVAPPASLLLAFCLGTLLIGICCRFFGELFREWWARANGRLLQLALTWLVATGIAFGAPFLWRESWNYVLSAGGVTWLATTAAGTLSALSARSGKEGQSGWREWLARVAPYVFIVGILAVVAIGVHAALRQFADTSINPPASADCPDPKDGWKPAYRLGNSTSSTLMESHSIDSSCAIAPFARYAEASLNTVKNLEYRGWKWLAGIPLAVLVVLGLVVDINIFSFHFFYRNRLTRCYLGASNGKRSPNLYTGLTDDDSPDLKDLAAVRPYPLINCTLNITHDPIEGATDRLGWQERKAASFVFSPLYCGYRLAFGERGIDAFQKTDGFDSKTPIPLAMAITISGAAASPNSGYHTNPATAFLMTMFNVRLGWWMENPRYPQRWRNGAKWLSSQLLLRELLGSTSDRSQQVYLSDGGHFENLGLYELVRRRSQIIIVSDASQDGGYTFEDLGNALRKCRCDFGVEIEIDPRGIVPDANGVSIHHCAVGLIRYPETEERPASQGQILYLKASISGDESADLLQYKAQHADFPHVSTSDQWFDESQFESYRKLGQHIGEVVIGNEYRRQSAKASGKGIDLPDLFDSLWRRWHRPSTAVVSALSRHGHRLQEIMTQLRGTPALASLDGQLHPDWKAILGGAPRPAIAVPSPLAKPNREIIYFCTDLFQFMENVYIDLRLQDDFSHPDVQGWMNLFSLWARSDLVITAWAVFGNTYGQRFRDFCEARLDFPKAEVILGRVPSTGGLLTTPAWLTGTGAAWFTKQYQSYKTSFTGWQYELIDFKIITGRVTRNFAYAVMATRAGEQVLVDFSIRPHLRGLGLGRKAISTLVSTHPTLKYRQGIGGDSAQALRDVLGSCGVNRQA